MNMAKFLRTAFFIKHRGGCFWSLPLPFEIIVKKTFQLFYFPQSILASELEKQPFTDVFQKKVFLKIFANFAGNTCVGVPS